MKVPKLHMGAVESAYIVVEGLSSACVGCRCGVGALGGVVL